MAESKFHYVDETNLKNMSYKLGRQIYDSGFRPTILIALWRGGAPIGMYIHGFFRKMKINIDHIPIKTESYKGFEQQKEIIVHDLDYIVKKANINDRILIIDDIFDSGNTAKKVIDDIRMKMRLNTPNDIKVATIFYKPTKRQVDFEPDYYHSISDAWLIFPHEIEDMTDEQILEYLGQEIYDLIKT